MDAVSEQWPGDGTGETGASDLRHRLAVAEHWCHWLEGQPHELLALVVHEFRNPLTGISGMAQLMQRRGQYSERAVATIIQRTQQLERLLGGLIDASRLAAGQLPLSYRTIDLVDLATTMVAEVRLTTDRHQLVVERTVDSLTGQWDEERLTQLLSLLLFTAIKYSPSGGLITLALARRETGAWLQVRDQGIGLTPQALATLFPRYRPGAGPTAQAVPDRRVQGAKLPLAICKILVEAHGGQILIDVEPTGGSAITIQLPLQPPPSLASLPVSAGAIDRPL